MDELTRAFYALSFHKQFFLAKGTEFQTLFSRIMSMRYPGDFVAVRPWGSAGDRKNDGYLPSRRMLFQCYAPNELTAATCVSKIDEDFAGAIEYWRAHFDVWTFVHNTEDLPPHVLQRLIVLGLQHFPVQVVHWGFEELRREVLALSERELADLLGPAPSRKALVHLGISDLEPILAHIAQHQPIAEPDLRPVPKGKLTYNQLSADAEALLTAGMSRADLLRKYFRLRPVERDGIAETFKRQYELLRGQRVTPDAILMELKAFAGGDSAQATPAAETAKWAVLAYFFEECDIFERPEGPS